MKTAMIAIIASQAARNACTASQGSGSVSPETMTAVCVFFAVLMLVVIVCGIVVIWLDYR